MSDTSRPAKAVAPDEWARRFKARICERLKPYKAEGHKGPGWTQAQAEQTAEAEYEATSTHDIMSGFEDDPEGAADECISYWGDGA